MSRWPIVPISELAAVRHGGTPSKANPAFWTGDIPWISPKDMKTEEIEAAADYINHEAVAQSATSVVPINTILVVARSGVLAHTLPVAICKRPVAFNQDIKAFIPNGRIDPRYLLHFLRATASEVIRDGVKKGATVHSLISGHVESLGVPLRSLDEQRRIVSMLDRADRIHRLRREALDKAKRLIPALFVKMFGDPATNPKGWPIERVGDVIQGFEGGRNLASDHDDSGNRGLSILKVSAVTSGTFNPREAKPAPKNYVPPAQHLVRRGDLLFSRANTVELVGATALVTGDHYNLLLPDKIWRFVWKEPSRVTPIFIHALFQMPATRQALSARATGTSDSMRNISQGKLLAIPIVVPPLQDQESFAKCAESVLALIARLDRQVARADKVQRQLSQYLFDGNGVSGGGGMAVTRRPCPTGQPFGGNGS